MVLKSAQTVSGCFRSFSAVGGSSRLFSSSVGLLYAVKVCFRLR